ncbi:hypothetical protein [Desertivirga arenae]|uniref:hypothetical protein n=1 Tax=Desertivirga arenae TaxID=2810309 RepID=UPI001A969118|nr:hypothetical protein [Pedobacter sp. SYSU D00823]
MRHQDNLSEAMEVFLKQLPDPNLTRDPTIVREINVRGRKVKFTAQKSKGLTGMTWRINSISSESKERN